MPTVIVKFDSAVKIANGDFQVGSTSSILMGACEWLDVELQINHSTTADFLDFGDGSLILKVREDDLSGLENGFRRWTGLPSDSVGMA